jgi:glucose-1-phosphate adenylyltransferase
MDYTLIRRGARLRRVIANRFNTIAADGRIGFDPDQDRRCLFVTESGLSVIPKGEQRRVDEAGEVPRYL